MYPRFSTNDSPYSFLTAQSYFFAEKIYAQLPNAYKKTGLLFSHSNAYQEQWIEDMKNLIEFVSESVLKETGIKLETEIKILE